MTTVKLDLLQNLSFSTRNGVVSRLQRKAIITGMTGWDDPQIFLESLIAIGIPKSGDSLEGFPDLVVTEVNPTLVDKDKTEVDIIYENKFNGFQYFKTKEFHDIGGNMSEPFVGEVDSNIQMVDTNEYQENGGSTAKTLITTRCTYSSTNEPVNGVSYAGKGPIRQTGTIQVPSIQKTWRGTGIIILRSANDAAKLVEEMNGKTNSNLPEGNWLGGEKDQWLCTAVKYKMGGHAQSLITGEFLTEYFVCFLTVEFQFNPNKDRDGKATGWNPEVVFIDDRTNKPPIKSDGETELVKNIGYKTIPYFNVSAETSCNFYKFLGACV